MARLGAVRKCSAAVVGLDLVLGYLWCGGVHCKSGLLSVV